MADQQQPPFYDMKGLCKQLDLKEGIVRGLIAEGLIPQPVAITKRIKAWPASDLPIILWILSHRERFRREELPPSDDPE